ncbi:HpcH/HpaI aldolase [Meredithblackwellia eburnea MCA 4105]
MIATPSNVRLVSSVEIAGLAAAAGWHSLLIDLEHGTFSLQDASQLCLAANSAGISPIVRVPQNTSEWISRSFDGGAQGIIVPHIESAEAARNVVKYSKFYPLGERSATYSHPMLRYTPLPGKIATSVVNSYTTVFCMIESQKGLDNLEDIAAVEGVDVLLIGCSDLTLDLGIHQQFDHPKVDEAVRAVCKAAKKNGKAVGVGALGARPDLLEKFGKYGVRFIMGAADMGLILNGATKAAAALEEINQKVQLT